VVVEPVEVSCVKMGTVKKTVNVNVILVSRDQHVLNVINFIFDGLLSTKMIFLKANDGCNKGGWWSCLNNAVCLFDGTCECVGGYFGSSCEECKK
jgi:hypothetical protein